MATALVGRITESATGVTVTEDISVGSLSYGSSATPPHAAFAACNQDYTSQTSTGAWAPISITFTETGSLPESGTVSGGSGLGQNTFGQTATGVNLVLDQNGAPVCDDNSNVETGGIGVQLTPEQPLELQGYLLLPGVLSNADPSGLPQSTLDELAIQLAFDGADVTGDSSTISGPKAALCDGTTFLTPFAALPFTNGDGTCTAAA